MEKVKFAQLIKPVRIAGYDDKLSAGNCKMLLDSENQVLLVETFEQKTSGKRQFVVPLSFVCVMELLTAGEEKASAEAKEAAAKEEQERLAKKAAALAARGEVPEVKPADVVKFTKNADGKIVETTVKK